MSMYMQIMWNTVLKQSLIEWVGRFRNIFTCHSNTNFHVIRYFYFLHIPLHEETFYNLTCIIFHISWHHAYVYIDIKSANNLFLAIGTLMNCANTFSHIETTWHPEQPERPRHLVLGRPITIVYWESRVHGTINGPGPRGYRKFAWTIFLHHAVSRLYGLSMNWKRQRVRALHPRFFGSRYWSTEQRFCLFVPLRLQRPTFRMRRQSTTYLDLQWRWMARVFTLLKQLGGCNILLKKIARFQAIQ